ncbi:hypothetical protein D3C80_1016700 [compost metagenome]
MPQYPRQLRITVLQYHRGNLEPPCNRGKPGDGNGQGNRTAPRERRCQHACHSHRNTELLGMKHRCRPQAAVLGNLLMATGVVVIDRVTAAVHIGGRPAGTEGAPVIGRLETMQLRIVQAVAIAQVVQRQRIERLALEAQPGHRFLIGIAIAIGRVGVIGDLLIGQVETGKYRTVGISQFEGIGEA